MIAKPMNCLVLALAGLLLAAAPVPSPAPTQATTTVPRGTVVVVRVTKDVRIGGYGDSTEAKKVEFEIAQDVVIGNHLLLKAGDLVEGHYTNQRNETRRMFSRSVSQELALDIDDAINYCGDTIHLQFERTYVGGGSSGFFALPHAHDAVFGRGVLLKAKTDRLQRDVCADLTQEQNPSLPDNVVVPDEETSPSPAPPKRNN